MLFRSCCRDVKDIREDAVGGLGGAAVVLADGKIAHRVGTRSNKAQRLPWVSIRRRPESGGVLSSFNPVQLQDRPADPSVFGPDVKSERLLLMSSRFT